MSGPGHRRFRFYTRIVQWSFFASRTGCLLLDPFSVEQINRTIRFCNLNPALYKSHSFGIGAATWAALKGFSDTDSPNWADGNLLMHFWHASNCESLIIRFAKKLRGIEGRKKGTRLYSENDIFWVKRNHFIRFIRKQIFNKQNIFFKISAWALFLD